MNNIIKDAIQNRKVLSLTYEGIARIVHPHAYGVSTAGNEVLRCYQVSGGHHNKTGRPHDWDLLTVSKISGLSATGDSFPSDAPGYKRADKAMSTIYAEL